MCRLLLLSSSKFSDVRNSPLSIYVCRFQEKNDVKALRRTPNAVVFEQAPLYIGNNNASSINIAPPAL